MTERERLMGRQISRRAVLRAMGGSLVAAGGLIARGWAPALARLARAQDEGTPAPQATPQLGPRADGTKVWRVEVGAMDEVSSIEVMAFLPGQITVNVGNTIFFENQGFHTVTFQSG